jgi:hypothetical protein
MKINFYKGGVEIMSSEKLKEFDVVISEQLAKTIRIQAKNIDDAENKVNEGKYDDNDIVDDDVVDWMIVDSWKIADE